jgi:drug/metabolite transporter (DMT)-like permease
VKYAAILPMKSAMLLVAAALVLVICLNFGRLLVWNAIHKRYPVSLAYPLSAIFFPGVVIIAWLMGEPVDGMQIAGGIVVMIGVLLMLSPLDADTQIPPNG